MAQLGWSCNLVSSYRFIACTYKYSDWTYDPTANAVLQRQVQHPTANVPSQRQTSSPTANATSAIFSAQDVVYQHHLRYAKESYHDAWLHGFALRDVCVLDQSMPTHLNPGSLGRLGLWPPDLFSAHAPSNSYNIACNCLRNPHQQIQRQTQHPTANAIAQRQMHSQRQTSSQLIITGR